MSSVDGTKLTLKVMINKQKSKVLFAEANNFVADALLGFLTLPLAKILRILRYHEMYYGYKAPVIGSLSRLYINLFCSDNSSKNDDNKLLFMGSMSLEVEYRKLLGDIFPKDYICSDSNCPHYGYAKVKEVSEIGICVCGEPKCGRALTKPATFVISDDLRVVPMHSGFLQTLNNLGISDIHGAEPKSLNLEFHDVVNLLKLSLTSSTPLTDLVFKNSEIKPISPKIEPIHMGRGIINHAAKIILKVSLLKSTNNFLFAEAKEDFVEFLFSMFALPLAEVVRRLDGNIPFKNIDNLYTSVADFIDEEYFRDYDTKTSLTNPKIDHGYFSLKQIVQIDGNDESKVFIVSDNLTVEPFSIATMVSKLNDYGISLSDVKETEIQIGAREALEILRASLVSKTALTDALITPMLSRLPKPQLENATNLFGL
ncbi:uncharacterized protein LOC130998431 [Salvia miltiorrhiza]|uniref:uncharacterized protein LOC130998431 n=1 Tax=Salvia miltiorrhiza TaxID=226208 RepID=UPI0025AD7456|nr:uncharacterized protein LOC130998431 [Salvia miltiorrhiza]